MHVVNNRWRTGRLCVTDIDCYFYKHLIFIYSFNLFVSAISSWNIYFKSVYCVFRGQQLQYMYRMHVTCSHWSDNTTTVQTADTAVAVQLAMSSAFLQVLNCTVLGVCCSCCTEIETFQLVMLRYHFSISIRYWYDIYKISRYRYWY